MATRIQRVSESVDRFASRRPRGFAALLAACLLAGAGAAVLALAALLDGPIGVELKERFRETGYSRLRVLQISSFVAGCFFGGVLRSHAQLAKGAVMASSRGGEASLASSRPAPRPTP